MAAKSIPGFEEFEGVWATRAPLGWDLADPEPAARGVRRAAVGLVPARPPGRSSTSTAACTPWAPEQHRATVAARAGRPWSSCGCSTGANLYFPRPAVKLTLDAERLLGPATRTRRERIAAELGLAAGSTRRGRTPGSGSGSRAAGRRPVVRRVAAEAGTTRLAVRSRPTARRCTAWSSPSPGGTAAGPRRSGAPSPTCSTRCRRRRSTAAVAARRATAVAAPSPGPRPRPGAPHDPRRGGHRHQRQDHDLPDGRAHGALRRPRRRAGRRTDGVYVDGELVEAGRLLRPGGARLVLDDPRVAARRHRDRARRDPAARHGRRAQRRLRRDQRLRRPPRAAGRSTRSTSSPRSRRSSPRSPGRAAGSCSTARTRGRSRCGSASPARPWVFSRDPDARRPAQRAQRGRSRRHRARRRHHRARRRRRPRPADAGRRRPHDAGRACRTSTSRTRWPPPAPASPSGCPRAAVVEGLRTFRPDPTHNPGRMNVYDLDGVPS